MLRIMKVIKKRQSQLNQLPSYFFKNILFKLCDLNWSESDWDRGNLVERLVVLGSLCISKKCLILMVERAKKICDGQWVGYV